MCVHKYIGTSCTQDVEDDPGVDLKEPWSKSIDTQEPAQQEEDVPPCPDTSDSPGTFAGIIDDLLSCKTALSRSHAQLFYKSHLQHNALLSLCIRWQLCDDERNRM